MAHHHSSEVTMTKSQIFRFMLFGIILGIQPTFSQTSSGGTLVEGRAVWASPGSVAFNDSSTQAFVEHCKRANINIIVLLTVASDQAVYFHSKKFPESVAQQFKDFDPLAAVIREAHKRGIRVHAWLCDFTVSPDGPIMKNHPEWAELNPEGKVTSSAEFLDRGRPYNETWMCPARRPGYTDQWLIPMIEEIVTDYDVDGIHHDYVRYPGDVAPDSYCFCDYCLDAMMKYPHLYYEAYPDSVFPIIPRLPNREANWSTDITVRPKDWDQWDRKKKAEFLLTGSFLKGGPSDLDYFFYTFRQDQINRFAREAWEHASAIKPNIEFSAAVFKNPIMSGRFIGQRWTDFSPWVDVMMPMVYRSHFPHTNYDTFITMLEEYTRYEYSWAKDRTQLSVGLDVHYMFSEERLFLTEGSHVADSLKELRGKDRDAFVQRLQSSYSSVVDHLREIAPDVEKKLTAAFLDLPKLGAEQLDSLQEVILSLAVNPPDDYYPKEKLRRAIEAVRKGGGNGIVIFDGGGLTYRKLWPALEDVFKEPSVEPFTVSSAAEMSIVTLKAQRGDIASMQRKLWYLGVLAVILLVALLYVINRKKKPASAPAVSGASGGGDS
jgi:uncharacterized lipoprotein YddW (UPF0748 family)